MADYTVSIKGADELVSALKKSEETVRDKIGKAVVKAARRVEEAVGTKAPHITGALKGSINVRGPIHSNNNIGAVVGTNLKYARAVEFGTGIYAEGEGATRQPIRPRRAKVLAWKKGGEWIFARQVAGMKPRRFFKQGVEVSQAEATKIISDGVGEVLKVLAQ